jgi:hypothetical protein
MPVERSNIEQLHKQIIATQQKILRQDGGRPTPT